MFVDMNPSIFEVEELDEFIINSLFLSVVIALNFSPVRDSKSFHRWKIRVQ